MNQVVSRKNLFVEMVQVYLEYKGINAKATINEDGLLDVFVDMRSKDSKALSKLLSKCMPISYVMTNTANKDTEKTHCKKCRKKVKAIIKDNELICPNCSKSLGAVFYKQKKTKSREKKSLDSFL